VINEKNFGANYPNLNNMIDKGYQNWGMYAGGVFDEDSQQPTWTDPGFTTLLTGTWFNKHRIPWNVEWNTYYYGGSKNAGPTIYNKILSTDPNVKAYMLASWKTITDISHFNGNGMPGVPSQNVFYVEGSPPGEIFSLEADKVLFNQTIKTLKEKSPADTYMYTIYLGVVDGTGHENGYDPKSTSSYMNSLRITLSRIDSMLQYINLDEWLVIITTDHGGHGNTHGSQRYVDRDIFALLYDNKLYKKENNLQETIQGQTSIVPTILNYLGLVSDVPLDSSYIGDAKLDNKTFFVTFPFDHGELKYPPKRMRFWPGIKDGDARKIVAVTQNNNRSYYFIFLGDGRVLNFNMAKNQVDAEEMVSKSWMGISSSDSRKIMAVALNYDETSYWFFLDDGRTLRFNINLGKVDRDVQIPEEWRGVSNSDAKRISGVAYHDGKSKYYIFLNNGRYMRYRLGQDEMVEFSGETGTDWPGLSPYSKHILAVSRDGYIFISMKNDLYGKYTNLSINPCLSAYI